ncbi:MAG: hypothetical protein NC078_01150 [Ruminococcus sp.]|nr:hypothetical protein [Ruminococcus sp.]
MRLYSKEAVVNACRAMVRTDRFVHSYIITGAQGAGKKTAARYLGMSLLCSDKTEEGDPCGVCKNCRRVSSGGHPDFIEVEKSKTSYSVDKDIRPKVVADSYISPNDCDRKVYLLADCDGWDDKAQDAMLKITEDPPEHAYFIFTGKTKEVFLPTLISRSMCLEIHEAATEQCECALRDIGKTSHKKKAFTEENIKYAARLFGGNIGCAAEYIEGSGKLAKAADTALAAAHAMARRDEYALAAALNSAAAAGTTIEARDNLRTALEMLMKVIRDSAAIRAFEGREDELAAVGLMGCDEEDSRMLAAAAGRGRLNEMYEAVAETMHLCTRNCNAAAAVSALAGKLSC